MNSKLRALRKVREARRRLRDHAASVAATAEQRLRDAQEAHRDAEEILDRVIDEASAAIVDRPRAAVLLLFDDVRQRASQEVGLAERVIETTSNVSEEARAALRARERELRSSEKLMDRMRAEQEAQIAKGEQRHADDLSATRTRRDR